jgi:N-methylhydantoinase A
MLSADVRHDYVRTMIAVTEQVDISRLRRLYTEMETEGSLQLAKEGFSGETIELVRLVDMRYVGQSYEITVQMGPDPISAEQIAILTDQFHQSHARAYGYARTGEPIEFVNLRMVALGKLPQSDMVDSWPEYAGPPEPVAWRKVYFEGADHPTAVFQRDQIGQCHPVLGPAIIEQLDSTIVIPPGYRGHIETYGNMLIEKETGA